jgi:hypothetical protein
MSYSQLPSYLDSMCVSTRVSSSRSAAEIHFGDGLESESVSSSSPGSLRISALRLLAVAELRKVQDRSRESLEKSRISIYQSTTPIFFSPLPLPLPSSRLRLPFPCLCTPLSTKRIPHYISYRCRAGACAPRLPALFYCCIWQLSVSPIQFGRAGPLMRLTLL